jgi:hypothetical protein
VLAIALLAGLLAVGALLQDTGIGERLQSGSALTGLAAGEFGTQEEPFSAEPVPNQPPAYAGGSLTTQQDVPLTLDLATLFSDPENDPLTFIATAEDVIDVAIEGAVAKFTPAPGFAGERTLTIIASDGVNILREPVKFVVEGNAPAEPVSEPEPEAPAADNFTAAPLEEPVIDNLTAMPVDEPVVDSAPVEPAAPEASSPQEPGFATQDVVDNCNPGPVVINTSTVLTQNIASNGSCISFGASNIVLDCAGFTIGYGQNGSTRRQGIIGLNNVNITIVSCNIFGLNNTQVLAHGVNFTNVSNSRIVNSTVVTNGSTTNHALALQDNSSNNIIANNTLMTRGTSISNYGIAITRNSHNNTIANNTIVTNSTGSGSNRGISVDVLTHNTTIENNSITTDGAGSDNIGIVMGSTSNGHRIVNNTIVTRRPGFSGNIGIDLLLGVSGTIVANNSIRTNGTSGSHGIRLTTTVDNNTVIGNFISAAGSTSGNDGILVTSAKNNTVANNIIFTRGTSDNVGIALSGSNFTVANNSVNANGTTTANYGINVLVVQDSLIVNNTIATGGSSSNDGIRLSTSANITIINNTIIARGSAGSNAGINFALRSNQSTVVNNTIFTNGTSSNFGIALQSGSVNNTIALNRVNTSGTSTSNFGIYLFTNADNNTIDNNTIIATGNGLSHGIRLETSAHSNRFFNNNVTTNDTGYGIITVNSNHSVFVNTRFSNASNWTSPGANTVGNNFTNTTFEEGNRRLTFADTIAFTAGTDVSKASLSLANNRVFLNGGVLTFLNRSAEIAFISLPFDDPQVLIDKEDDGTFIHCPFGFCNETSYANGEFSFVVQGFTTYATAEGNTTLTKTDSLDPAVPGELLTYFITVEVSGNNASNVTITDQYPSHVAFNTSQPSPVAGTNDTFILGNLTSGQSVTVNITVLVLNGSLNGVVVNNTVNISYQNSTGDTITFNTTENTTLVTGCPGTIIGNTIL